MRLNSYTYPYGYLHYNTWKHLTSLTLQIPVVNSGEIPGRVESFGPVSNSSALSMKVEPKRIKLAPNEHSAFYVTFACSGKPVEFHEELKFVITSSEEIIYITVK